jgi:hypothetical protein
LCITRVVQDIDGESGHQASILLNEAYNLLTGEGQDPYTKQLRQAKEDFADGFTGQENLPKLSVTFML